MRRIPKNHVAADFQFRQAGVTGFRSIIALSAFSCADYPWKGDPAVGFCISGSGMAADYRPCALLTAVRASAGYAQRPWLKSDCFDRFNTFSLLRQRKCDQSGGTFLIRIGRSIIAAQTARCSEQQVLAAIQLVGRR
jgi:hypothetical protein